MATFNDLPNELIIQVIEEIIPDNQYKLTIGVNAPWNRLETYHGSLKLAEPSDPSESDSDTPLLVSIYADLLALRS